MGQSVELSAHSPSAAWVSPQEAGGHWTVEVLSGFASVLRAEPAITRLLKSTGQSGNPILGLSFFVGRVRSFRSNRPVVLMVSSGERLECVVYLYEKLICGVPTGYLRGFDHLSGESCVIAPAGLRASLLKTAVHQLFLLSGARMAWATVADGEMKSPASDASPSGPFHMETATITRRHRLKLNTTFDETVRRFGQHTRRNLRYYRRRAEKELQVSFHPLLTIADSEQAWRQLSKEAFQPFSRSLAEWQRMDSLLRIQPGYFAMGLRAGNDWVSYLVGIRTGQASHIVLQMNHNGFGRYSLSTVMRSYFFEHEIACEQKEAKFVNGTCAFFQRCCEPDTCFTVSARRGLVASAISHWIAPRYNAPDHALNMRTWWRQPRLLAKPQDSACG